MLGRRTALVVTVAEAEPAVESLRRQLDPVARLGVPAHVTVLFPFMPASEVNDDVIVRLTALFRSTGAFEYTFVGTGWFGEEVLWLAPEPFESFKLLTRLVWTAFPSYPPYEGQFDEVVPHLTIADHALVEDMQAAERAVQRSLPITATAREVTLMVEQFSGRWEGAESFTLGGWNEPMVKTGG